MFATGVGAMFRLSRYLNKDIKKTARRIICNWLLKLIGLLIFI